MAVPERRPLYNLQCTRLEHCKVCETPRCKTRYIRLISFCIYFGSEPLVPIFFFSSFEAFWKRQRSVFKRKKEREEGKGKSEMRILAPIAPVLFFVLLSLVLPFTSGLADDQFCLLTGTEQNHQTKQAKREGFYLLHLINLGTNSKLAQI